MAVMKIYVTAETILTGLMIATLTNAGLVQNVFDLCLVYIFSFSLPQCFCSVSGQEVPGGLAPERVPQMIMLSFDDAINNNNEEIFNELFDGKLKNPNGCDVKATFFVSHRYNNYSMAQVNLLLFPAMCSDNDCSIIGVAQKRT